MEENIHNNEGALKRTLERIKGSGFILKNNKEIMLKFKENLKSMNMSDATINRSLYSLMKLDELLRKPFPEANKDDIKAVIARFNERQPNGKFLKEESKKKLKIHIRAIYCFIKGIEKKGVYPEEVDWISISMPKNSKKLPEELLTEEEINSIIKHCKTTRDRALVATLADSGCRISEIGTMRIKHVSFEGYGARLIVNGKTGMRKILVINCVPYLQEWINMHPNNSDPDSFLWCDSNKNLLSYARMSDILKRSAKNAKIKKRIYPHLLRHSKATNLAPIMSEAGMKQYFGWGQDSKMCATYIHLSGRECDEAILRANGVEIKKEITKSALQPKACLRCKTINEVTNKFCKVCSFPLDEETHKQLIIRSMEKEKSDNIMDELIKDKDVLALLVEKIKFIR